MISEKLSQLLEQRRMILSSGLDTLFSGPVLDTVEAQIVELLAMKIREDWLIWASRQPDVAAHPNWVLTWDELAERDKDADRCIARGQFELLLPRSWRGGVIMQSSKNVTARPEDIPESQRPGPGAWLFLLDQWDAGLFIVVRGEDDEYRALFTENGAVLLLRDMGYNDRFGLFSKSHFPDAN